MKYLLFLKSKYVNEYDSFDDAEKAAGRIAKRIPKGKLWEYGFSIYERPEHHEIEHSTVMDKKEKTK